MDVHFRYLMILILTFIITASITGAALLWLAKNAVSLKLIDIPTERKRHVQAVPAVGGLAIAFSLVLTSPIWLTSSTHLVVGLCCLCMTILGVADDRFSLPSLYRFPVQIIVSLGLMIFADIYIVNIGNIYGQGDVILAGATGIIFTSMCTVGVINSINMIDGIDGLSSSILGASLTALLFVSLQNNSNSEWNLFIAAVLGALFTFFLVNSRLFLNRALVFMGDAGTMMLGLFILVMFIVTSQGENASLSPVAAGWVFGLPLIDTMSVMVRRIFSGKSPFLADRTHLHHMMLDAGFTVNETVSTMTCLHISLIVFGLMLNQHSEFDPLLFWTFVILVLAHFFITPRLLKFRKNISQTVSQS